MSMFMVIWAVVEASRPAFRSSTKAALSTSPPDSVSVESWDSVGSWDSVAELDEAAGSALVVGSAGGQPAEQQRECQGRQAPAQGQGTAHEVSEVESRWCLPTITVSRNRQAGLVRMTAGS